MNQLQQAMMKAGLATKNDIARAQEEKRKEAKRRREEREKKRFRDAVMPRLDKALKHFPTPVIAEMLDCYKKNGVPTLEVMEEWGLRVEKVRRKNRSHERMERRREATKLWAVFLNRFNEARAAKNDTSS